MFYGDAGAGIKKPSKRSIEEFLSCIVGINYSLLTFEKVEERPRVWKHSCTSTGVVILHPLRAIFFSVMIDYVVCSICGKVIYYYEEYF